MAALAHKTNRKLLAYCIRSQSYARTECTIGSIGPQNTTKGRANAEPEPFNHSSTVSGGMSTNPLSVFFGSTTVLQDSPHAGLV